jgi:hypothetical protein
MALSIENYIKDYAKSIPRTIVQKIMQNHPYIPIPQNLGEFFMLGTLSSTSIDSVSSLNLLHPVSACQPRGPQ